ncbi:MAG: hypothetical protein LBQ73_02225 [Tannerellaceae bacterium]|jgi:hypothetical protein|nr:hypothetical protein [Tannerellaceae bacterium]
MTKTTNKPVTFCLLDGSVVSYGFRVVVEGVDLTQFLRNSVMFYHHRDYSLPIGRWANVRVEKGRILADAEFDYEDTDEEVRRIIGKVERGFIKMASVGLTDLKFSEDESLMLPGQTLPTMIKCTLREASIVNIGANYNALRLYDNEGKEIDLQNEVKLSDVVRPAQTNKYMNELLKLLNLSDGATDAQIAAAVLAIIAERKTLSDQLAAYEKKEKDGLKTEAVALVDAAVRDGRIDASGRETYLKFFDADHEGAKAALLSIPKRQSVTQQIAEATGVNQTELADLQKQDWDALDRTDRLVTLRDKYPDLYKEKYKAKFGVEPK